MKIGLLARDDNTGLGTQTWEFARAMKPHKVLIYDIKQLNESVGKKTERYPERYADFNVKESPGYPTESGIDWLTDDVDVVFVIETPINWRLFTVARQKNVPTVLQYNYEFLEHLTSDSLPQPDLFLAPSKWHYEQAEQAVRGWGRQIDQLPVPVSLDRLPVRHRTEAKRFVHIAGHQTHADRNGTTKLLDALQWVQTPTELVIYHQYPIEYEFGRGWCNVQFKSEVKNYWDLYHDGDVLICPRRYGGLSLQIQEALASGMPVIVGHHDPYANTPGTLMVRSTPSEQLQLLAPIQTHNVMPRELSAMIDRINQSDISDLSDRALAYAESISWEKMAGRYKHRMEILCSEMAS